MSTVSKLASGTYIAAEGNYEHGRAGKKICKFTPHHMAGILTAKQCAVNIFQKPGREASANYCIGNDGEIVCNVYEEDRAYTSSSRTNDRQAITVEVSNCEIGGQWKISDAAWNSLVNLAVDVCKRHGFRLSYDGTSNGSLTTHDMFSNTNCPGPYLKGKMQELASTVNSILDGSTTTSTPTQSTSTQRKVGDVVTINGVYTASNSTKRLNPARTTGTITKIINGALNPYLLDNGDLGWVNDNVIVSNSSSSNTQNSKKSNEEIAAEVWAGKWGTGTERKNRLQAAGYDYNTIQNLVNRGVGKNGSTTNNTTTSSKSALDVAREIWTKGNWGTGSERKRKVEAAGYNYDEVEKYVNEFASGKRK